MQIWRMPMRWAAMTFSLMPPTGSTTPRSEISPVCQNETEHRKTVVSEGAKGSGAQCRDHGRHTAEQSIGLRGWHALSHARAQQQGGGMRRRGGRFHVLLYHGGVVPNHTALEQADDGRHDRDASRRAVLRDGPGWEVDVHVCKR